MKATKFVVGAIVAGVLIFLISWAIGPSDKTRTTSTDNTRGESGLKVSYEGTPPPAPPATQPTGSLTVEPLVLKRNIGPYPYTAKVGEYADPISTTPPDNLMGYYDFKFAPKDPTQKVWVMPDGNPKRVFVFPDDSGNLVSGKAGYVQFKSLTDEPVEMYYIWRLKKEYVK